MKHYYILDSTQSKGFLEITEAEWLALMGDETTSPYASQVYHGSIMINDVPEDLREIVSNIVEAKIARFGKYSELEEKLNV